MFEGYNVSKKKSYIDSIPSSNHPISSSILVSLHHCIITSIILGGIILSTITGNVLVIAAVILEKSLHSVAYYLFVSLAVTDLMVAMMVSHLFRILILFLLFFEIAHFNFNVSFTLFHKCIKLFAILRNFFSQW